MNNVVEFAPPLKFLGLLMRGNARQILANTANALILIDLDPTLAGMFAWDEFMGRCVMTRPAPPKHEDDPLAAGPYPRPPEEHDVQLLLGYMQRSWTSAFSFGVVERAIPAVARSHPFHPIKAYLDTLVWDGTRRLDIWLQATFDAPDTAYTRAVGVKWLVAAVRRVRQPGCKFDFLPIFEGLQGLGKSQTLGVLFGGDWFTDSLPHDLASRDSLMALHGIWAGEFPEIDQIIRSDVETVKAYLSRGKDRYRVPYGRGFIEVLRQCVLCGTTNSQDYLRDVSGNRRFWPIECRNIDPDWIGVNRDQLWAEACAREDAGESIWLDDREIAKAAIEMQASRLTEDTWEEALAGWLLDKNEASTADALSLARDIERERQDRKATLRVCDCLRKLGWQQTVSGRGGASGRRIWRRRGSP
jgi:predicted P-loop ATPase